MQENSSSRQEKHLSSSEPSGQSTLPSHSRVEEIQGGPPEPQLNSVLEQVGGGGGGQSSSSVPSSQSAAPSHRLLELMQAPASHLHSAGLHRSKHQQLSQPKDLDL